MNRLGLLLALVLAPGLQAQAPERVLVELQLGRIASRTVEAYRAGEDALVPLGVFFELAELRATRGANGALEAIVQPGNVPLRIEPASQIIRFGKERIPLGRDEVFAAPGETYLSTAVLGRLLRLDWAVSWADLQVTVIDPDQLPIARRIRREAMLGARLPGASVNSFAALRLGLERPRVNGMVLDYSLLTPTTGIDGAAYSTLLGLDVFGGSFALGLTSQNGPSEAPRTEASWNGVWRENRWVSQVRLGDGFATGPRGRSLRGFSVSNSPFARPSVLGNVPFAGELGAGWTIEAYRGGRIVGFDSVNALGQFSFDVPVQYGENPVDFVAYGPFGEIREFNRTYRVRSDGLPARSFEYAASAGECRTDRCGATANLDLRYGLSNRWVARAGMDQFWRDSLDNLSHPYVGVAGSIGNALSLETELVADAVLRGAVRFEPTINLQLQAEMFRFARGVADPLLTPIGRERQFTLNAFFRPVPQFGATYLEAGLDRISGSGGEITSGRLGGSTQVAGVRLLPAVRFQRISSLAAQATTQTFLSLNTFVLPQPSLGPTLGLFTARTSLEIEPGVGASSASGYLGVPLLRGLRAETGLSWYRGGRGATFSFMLAAELPTVRSYTTVTAGNGQTLGSQYVSGSAIYNPSRSGVDFSGTAALERGGVTGKVYLDENSNGRQDPGEPGLPEVRVIVGPTFSFTDSNGVYRVWDILPYEPTSVMVDSTTLASPLWVPAFGMASVEPSPNRYRRLDLAVLPGGVAEGTVSWGAGRAGAVGGVTLVFKHVESGEQRVVTTFSDGSFYVMGLRPGSWELGADSRCLETLGATVEMQRFVIAASAEGTALEGLKVELR